MVGTQVLEWTDLDSEIKTAGLKDVSGFPSIIPCGLIVSDRTLLLLQICMSRLCRRGDSVNPGTIGWLTLTCAIIGDPVSRSKGLRL